jgi:hypothetical protein
MCVKGAACPPEETVRKLGRAAICVCLQQLGLVTFRDEEPGERGDPMEMPF